MTLHVCFVFECLLKQNIDRFACMSMKYLVEISFFQKQTLAESHFQSPMYWLFGIGLRKWLSPWLSQWLSPFPFLVDYLWFYLIVVLKSYLGTKITLNFLCVGPTQTEHWEGKKCRETPLGCDWLHLVEPKATNKPRLIFASQAQLSAQK